MSERQLPGCSPWWRTWAKICRGTRKVYALRIGLDGANKFTVKEDKHGYVALANSTRIYGANTVGVMFGTPAQCCDQLQLDRTRGYLGGRPTQGEASLV